MNIINRYAQLPSVLFHYQSPTPLQGQAIAGHFNTSLAQTLQWSDQMQEQWLAYCSGQKTFDTFNSLAMVYAGHQFGQWAGQLGDGRGLLIAQCYDDQDHIIDLHLKGAGKTPYSRHGDGRAVLRSTIREYLAGHSLHALGIATSQAIGFCTTDQINIQRETLEHGAMLLRTADSHIRFGHFEWIAHYQPQLLDNFTQTVMQWHAPQCLHEELPVLAFVQHVIQRTAKLIAQWQLIGFTHGVMNTDNFSITGSTLDFGPFAFMERFTPAHIYNHSDYQGRYTYQNQPSIAHWNLWTWINCLIPLAPHGMKPTQWQQQLLDCLDQFETIFLDAYQQGLAFKMGLPDFHIESWDCSIQFLQLLQQQQLDYSQSFILLQQQQYDTLRQQCSNPLAFDHFLQHYQKIREYQDHDHLHLLMQQHNPYYILRTHSLQQAIRLAEQFDFSEVERLFTLLATPYQLQPHLEKPSDRQAPPLGTPDICLSCSS